MSMVNITAVHPPAVEPVTLAMVKHHLGIPVEMAEDDAYLMGLVAAARRLAEVRLGRSLMASKWRAAYSGASCTGRCGFSCRDVRMPAGTERLPRGPVLYGDDYEVRVFRENAHGNLDPIDAGLVHVYRFHDAVAIETGWEPGMWVEWWAGSTDPRDIPQTLKAAILVMAGIFYSNRGDGTQEGETATAWDAVQALVMAEWDGRIYHQ